MRRNTLAAVAVLGAVALGAGTVVAQQAGGPRKWDPAAIQAEIGLSDEQAAALRELRQQERQAAKSRREEMRTSHRELEELLKAPTLDEAAIAAHVETLAGLQAAAVKARAGNELAVRRVVSPEQYQKLRQVRMRMRHRAARAGRAGWRHSASTNPA